LENRKQTDWWRLTQIAVAILLSSFIGHRFQPMVANNPDAVNTVVMIFSILAGFLIVVITFITEPIIKQARNLSELQIMKNTVRNKLIRHKILFYLYLLTLGLSLVMHLTPPQMLDLLKWLQTVFLGLATFVFFVSFSLPGSLMKIQMDRYEVALEDSRPAVVSKAKRLTGQAKKQ
jgi:magnesium-transporting ATPase (P-type)